VHRQQRGSGAEQRMLHQHQLDGRLRRTEHDLSGSQTRVDQAVRALSSGGCQPRIIPAQATGGEGETTAPVPRHSS
jgi:hypothetical protein